MNKCKIAELEIISYSSLEQAVSTIITKGKVKSGFAVAINAEKIVSSVEDSLVKAILKSATIRYPDGAGVSILMGLRGHKSARIPGCDLWVEIMKKAAETKLPVFILGGKLSTNNETVKKLKDKFGSNVADASDGYFSDDDLLIKRIVKSEAKIITVALGSPRQEQFIKKCRLVYPGAFYMGVGGTYDVFTNQVVRAPTWTHKYHLEWLYRLCQNPKRFARQIKLVKYIFLIFTKRI
jgi:UDP-N-acetyl-D-mannosaminouronate:lipid I N-acetyl-D-mannosaminouronosyltransferase